jgi:hypothetical protein
MLDREQVIVDALRRNPDYNEAIRKRVEGEMCRDTFFKTRDRLVIKKEIVRKELGRRVLLYLPEDKELMEKKIEPGGRKGIDEDSKNKYREKHTEDIKNKVIRPWLELLPTEIGRKRLVVPYLINFSKVNRALFDDFKKHIKFSPNPFDELEIYKAQRKEFIHAKKDLQHKVYSMIDRELDLDGERFWFKYDSISEKLTDFLCFSDNGDDISYSLLKWIYGILEEWYSYFYEHPVAYEYHIKRDNKDDNYGRIYNQEIGGTEFMNKMDKHIDNIMKRVKESEDIHDDIMALYEMKRELVSYLKNISESLEKHLELLILPNDCKYYPWKH